MKKGSEAIFTDLKKFLDEVFGFGEEVADNALTAPKKRVKDKNAARARRLAARSGLISKELKTLLRDSDFKEIYWDLSNGKVKRAFGNLLKYEEEAVLKFYTTNAGYKNFNKALRGEIKITEFYKTQEKMMNEALEKLPIYESENLLYRIENLTDAQINEYYKVGKDIENKHFTSTSYSADAIAESMKKRPYSVLIRIESKNGRLIESLSIKREEKEIIFSSKTKFYVKEITNTNNPLDYSEIKTIKLIEK